MKTFKNIKTFQFFVRRLGKGQKRELPDVMKVGKIVYTMEEYDMSGKEISYANKRTTNRIVITTSNRYEQGFGDAEVELMEKSGFYRNDINFVD